jgi:hypothetical protein
MGEFQKSSKKISDIKRKINSRPLRTRILIVCEGMKTEPNYFKSFRVNAQIEIEEAAGNTISLIRKAQEVAEGGDFDQIWCVFDRDSFPNGNFNNAIHAATASGFRAAYTNEAFELWYLLHFNYHISALSRHQYSKILSNNLGKNYQKNDTSMYELLLSRQATAIANADRLMAFRDCSAWCSRATCSSHSARSITRKAVRPA